MTIDDVMREFFWGRLASAKPLHQFGYLPYLYSGVGEKPYRRFRSVCWIADDEVIEDVGNEYNELLTRPDGITSMPRVSAANFDPLARRGNRALD